MGAKQSQFEPLALPPGQTPTKAEEMYMKACKTTNPDKQLDYLDRAGAEYKMDQKYAMAAKCFAYSAELMIASGEKIAGAEKLADAGMMANRAGNAEQALTLLNEATQQFPARSESAVRKHQSRVRDFLVSAATNASLDFSTHWQQVQKAIRGLRSGGESTAADEVLGKLITDLLNNPAMHTTLVELLDAEMRAAFMNIMAEKRVLHDLCLKRCLAGLYTEIIRQQTEAMASSTTAAEDTSEAKTVGTSVTSESLSSVLESTRTLIMGDRHEMKEWRATPLGIKFVELLDDLKRYPAPDATSAAILRVDLTKKFSMLKAQSNDERVLVALCDGIQEKLKIVASDEDYNTVANLPKKSSEEIASGLM